MATTLESRTLRVERVMGTVVSLDLRSEESFATVRATGRLDPSALVKGWAAQRAADLLTASYEAMTILLDGTVLSTPGFPLLEDAS